MRPLIGSLLGVGTLVLSGCPPSGGDPGAGSQRPVESVLTDLGPPSCRQEIDASDPNETPYLVCPGVAGYSLVVRSVAAGRRSIDVVNAERQAFPLDYHEFVTRHMASLDSTAEWRVASTDGSPVPIALIVGVLAREDVDDPEVTRRWWAVAKIAPGEACVTDRIPESERSAAEVRVLADTARERPCLSPRPPITSDGAVGP